MKRAIVLWIALLAISWPLLSVFSDLAWPAPVVFTADRPLVDPVPAARAGSSSIDEAADAAVSYPTTPPDAGRIHAGQPNLKGIATVTGEPGAVPPGSAVLVVNLNSRSLNTTTANTAGAFSARLFAPPGSALLVKYGRVGEEIAQLWQDSLPAIPPDVSYINPLPGTILPLAPLPPTGSGAQPFHSAGRFGDDASWAGWWISGTVSGPAGADLRLSPGDGVAVNGRLHITSPALNCTDPGLYSPRAHLHLRYLFDDDGGSHPWGIWFNAHLFTPTGLPIEHEANGEVRPVISTSLTNLTCQGAKTLSGELSTDFTVPVDLPPGTYQIEAFLEDGGFPQATNIPRVVVWYHFDPLAFLPLLTVGDPAPPRIPWTLFGDYPVNGDRGVQAVEDRGRFNMTTRVVLPPELPTIPRFDPRTGEPLTYRLEPGSAWLSATDRRMPNPPRLPLIFPSGELAVTIHKPDGSVDTIGPVPIIQSAIRTPTTPGGTPLDHGTGHVGDLYHLFTGDERFAYQFEQDGFHTLVLQGSVEDIYGRLYPIEATYEIVVGRVLDLDPAQLPMTPYQVGDAFAPGLHLFPPVPADVSIRLIHMPWSNPAAAVSTMITGQANRFGYFQPPPGTEIIFDTPGEFRVDLTARYEDDTGALWAGQMTWGNVVQDSSRAIDAHGRRGMDYHGETIADMPAWFKIDDLPPEKIGIEVYYPYFSGDIHWGVDVAGPGDSIHSIITIEDRAGLDGPIYNLLRANFPRSRNGFRWPPDEDSPAGLEKRLAVGEAPLFISTASGVDAGVDPANIDQWGYWYAASERPDVRVREIISEDNMGTAYWRFNDTYGYQIGEGATGDLPGDLKWEFGGAVLRVPGIDLNEYAIYSSLWVLLPPTCDPVGCARVSPPFQDATGASFNGGPILTLRGEEIDMLFLPKGIRPGDVLEVGDTVAFSGHVGPPLDSRVVVKITSPTGVIRQRAWHASPIGWLYDPSFDFVAGEPGRWTVEVLVEHDRPYIGNGIVPQRHNTGTVLGSGGRYSFYVVPPGSDRLFLYTPPSGFIHWPAGEIVPVVIHGSAPAGTTAVHYTIHDKGIVIDQGEITPDARGFFTLVYDPIALQQDFPMVSLIAREGIWPGLADEVALNLLATGGRAAAGSITLIGEEVFNGNALLNLQLPLITRP